MKGEMESSGEVNNSLAKDDESEAEDEPALERIRRELCLIPLCWPTIQLNETYLRSLPCSYYTLSDKEKLLLWHAENFRKQFHAAYPDRKPLILARQNECGAQVTRCIIVSFPFFVNLYYI